MKLSRRRRWYLRPVQLNVIDQSDEYRGYSQWYVLLRVKGRPSIVRQAVTLRKAVREVRAELHRRRQYKKGTE